MNCTFRFLGDNRGRMYNLDSGGQIDGVVFEKFDRQVTFFADDWIARKVTLEERTENISIEEYVIKKIEVLSPLKDIVQPNLNELNELANRFDQTNLGRFLEAATPIVRVFGLLVEAGYQKVANENVEPVRLLSPKEMRVELGDISERTLLNYQKRWAWFRPAFGRGKGQRFESTLVKKVIEAKRNEGL